MSTITFPSTLNPATFTWAQQRRDVAFSSLFGSQAAVLSSPLWMVTLSAPNMLSTGTEAGAWKSLLLQLRGKVNQLELWNMAQPAPNGTMRGTMLLNGGHAQGATTLSIIAATQPAKTLLAGDFIGLGDGTTSQQVVMVTADATSDGTGLISVSIEPPLRNGFANASAVAWDKPSALFRMTNTKSSWEYAPGKLISGFALDLVEDWRT
jgi:hypothetical protein